ncbi:MAG: histidine kinase [Clostridia bacterium]
MPPSKSHWLSGRLRNLSVRRRLMLLFSMIVLLLLTSMSALFQAVTVEYRTSLAKTAERTVSRVVDRVEATFQWLEAITKYPIIMARSSNSAIYNSLVHSKNVNALSSFTTELEYLRGFLLEQDINLRLMGVYDLTGKNVIVKNNRRNQWWIMSAAESTQYDSNVHSAWFQETLARNGSAYRWQDSKHNIGELNLTELSDVAYVSRALLRVDNFTPIGVILLGYDLWDIKNELNAELTTPSSQLAYWDHEGTLLLGNMEESFRLACIAYLQNGSPPASGAFGTVVNGVSGTFYYEHTAASTCAMFMPAYNAWQDRIYLAVMIALLAGLLFFITRAVIHSIERPVARLSQACDTLVQTKAFSVKIQDDGRDELNALARSFNEMINTIEHLIHDVYEKKTELTLTELQLLRSQINPHFLYNALDTIRARALLAGQTELGDMVMYMASLLRYSISKPDELVELSMEIGKLNEYAQLQRSMYCDRVTVHMEIEHELTHVKIPKFILQPILENAFYHGLGRDGSEGVIEVLGYREGDECVFRVIDNGDGIPPQSLERIRQSIDLKDAPPSGIGLRNVHRRLRLLYGEPYGLTIESQEQVGTVITLRLPIGGEGAEHGGDPDCG